MWRGFYLNIDKAAQRRKSMEEQIAKFGVNDKISRYVPVDLETSRAFGANYNHNQTLGQVSLSLSTEKILRENAGLNKHILLLEDDTVLLPNSILLIDALVGSDFEQDMIFLNCDLKLFGAPVDEMGVYFKKYRAFRENPNKISVLDAKTYYTASTNAILFNKNSLNKVADNFKKYFLQAPSDIIFRHLFATGLLKGGITFPFMFTLEQDLARNSTLGDENSILDYTKEMMFVETLHRIRKCYAIKTPLNDILAVQAEVDKNLEELKTVYFEMTSKILDGNFAIF